MKQLPQFSSSRCKRCGICVHFCALQALDARDGLPYLADPSSCTSCGLCRDMCPDWAVYLEPTPVEVVEESAEVTEQTAEVTEDKRETRAEQAPQTEESAQLVTPSGNGSGSLEAAPAPGD